MDGSNVGIFLFRMISLVTLFGWQVEVEKAVNQFTL